LIPPSPTTFTACSAASSPAFRFRTVNPADNVPCDFRDQPSVEVESESIDVYSEGGFISNDGGRASFTTVHRMPQSVLSLSLT